MASIDPTLSRDRLLYEVAADLTSSLDLDEVLRRVLDKVIDLMNASRGYVVLVEEGILRVRVARTETGISEGTEFSGSRTFVEQCIHDKKPLLTTDAVTDARFKGQVAPLERVRTQERALTRVIELASAVGGPVCALVGHAASKESP